MTHDPAGPPAAALTQAPSPTIGMPPFCERHTQQLANGQSIYAFSQQLGAIQNSILAICMDADGDSVYRTDYSAIEVFIMERGLWAKAPLCCYLGDARFTQLVTFVRLHTRAGAGRS